MIDTHRSSGNSAKDPVAKLVFELAKLPGVGEKTATRLAYFIIRQNEDYADALSIAVKQAKSMTHFCSECFNLTDQDPCRICANTSRRNQSLCVVEKPSDILPIEQTGSFKGVYHVLHGVLSPLEGIGPDELKIKDLIKRLESDSIDEIIIALNPSVEGDATALYLSKLIQPLKIKVTRLAYGIPVGGRLEFTDHQTISRAIENRMEIR